jgi:phosphoribosylaminoimidazolecarboxamide formyltransferase / IMP cyclohydrolase
MKKIYIFIHSPVVAFHYYKYQIMRDKKISCALISVYCKDGLAKIVSLLDQLGVSIYSTGGTFDFIHGLEIPVKSVESLTTYPSILGGRVKTLHPSVFGGILARRDNPGDMEQLSGYKIPVIDLVIVDLYPFYETVSSTASEEEIIEKIDIGGISLIRAAAKNFNDVLVISGRKQYGSFAKMLNEQNGVTSLEERKKFAAEAFMTSSGYDTAIFSYFNREAKIPAFRESIDKHYELRYGENPHQKGIFYGDIERLFERLHGKEISFNNLLDIEAAVNLIDEFSGITFAIIKHNNACGVAIRTSLMDAWKDALACDPVSAYGGVITTNRKIDKITAAEMDKLFCEIIISPGYDDEGLEILKQKKNRIILLRKDTEKPPGGYRSLLNGVLWQERDNSTESVTDMKPVTTRVPDKRELNDLVFANIIVKHSKSNAIVLALNNQLCASGIGQTSRVDALRQAIEKAKSFGFDLKGAVMASDAFFPFADCVEIAHKAGITAVVQPGGSVRDKDSVDYCNQNGIAMVFTGVRHFKH